jgi:hypothetical protein
MIIILRKFVEIEILSNAALDTIREALTAPKTYKGRVRAFLKPNKLPGVRAGAGLLPGEECVDKKVLKKKMCMPFIWC